MTPEILRAETLSTPTTDDRLPTTEQPPKLVGGRWSVAGRRSWLKWLLIGIVVTYVAVLIVVPLVALIAGAFSRGLGAIGAALSEPDVISAFGRTLLIALI